MKTVELVEGIHSSVLGFGCAPILGSVDARKARQALECAIDYGINHLDLARSYGYGEAEHFVGKIIKGRRNKVIIASKFGIRANWKASILRPVKPLVRLVRNKRCKPSHINSTLNVAEPITIPDIFHDRIPFRANTMRNSLEQSLRALGTDYLDFFFVHEPPGNLGYIDELTAMAELLKEEGKIRAWGLAYMRSQETFHKDYFKRFDLLQFNNSPGASGYDSVVTKRGLLPNVIFSPLRGGTKELSPLEKIRKLLKDFPRSVVLCSMYNEQHIRENVKAIN